MILFLSVIYIVLLLMPFYKKRNDYFSPPILFAVTMGFYTLPDVINIVYNGENNYVSNLSFQLKSTAPVVVLQFLFFQILFVASYYVGFYIKEKKYYKIRIIKNSALYTENRKLNLMIALFGIITCFVSTILFINKMGGYEALLMSFTDRAALKEETPFLQQNLGIIITMSSAFCIKYITQTNGKVWHFILLCFLLFVGFISQTTGGARSLFVVFVLSILCYYNYWGKRISLFSKTLIPVYVGLGLFILVFQVLRFGGLEGLSIDSLFENGEGLFESMSYVKTQILIQSYFSDHDYWYGAVYRSLLYVFVPRSMFPDKPFIDEGGYIYNMIFNPSNVLSSNDFVNSWPPFTMGISYANFGIVGLIIGGLLLGNIHAFFYNKIRQYNFPLFILVLYIFVVLKFQLTVFYICQLIYLTIELVLVFYFYRISRIIIPSKR